jgi:hypothetical protein
MPWKKKLLYRRRQIWVLKRKRAGLNSGSRVQLPPDDHNSFRQSCVAVEEEKDSPFKSTIICKEKIIWFNYFILQSLAEGVRLQVRDKMFA